jgi:glycosyltransferase 2 family protein
MKKKNPVKFTKSILFRYALQGAILGVLANGAVFLYTQSDETFIHLQQFRWDVGAMLFVLVLVAWVCNGGRIYLLSRSLGYPLSYKQSISISLSSEFGIAATPAGMGGAAIRLGLLRRAGVPLAHGTSMLATDVAMDSLYFLLLFPFAIMSLARNPKVTALFQQIGAERFVYIGVGAVGVVLLAVFLIRIGFVQFCVDWLSKHPMGQRHRIQVRFRLFARIIKKEMHRVREGVSHLFQLRWGTVLCTFVLASMQWTCRYSILPVLLYAFSIVNDPVLLFLMQGALFTVSLIFVLPGGGGGVEVLTAVILNMIIPPPLVGVVILLWRFFTYHLYLFGGGSVFFWTSWHIHTLFPEKAVEYDEEDIAFADDEIPLETP